ncbi:hypothetical protein [Bradyrhizobium cosmicum]|uniref:hypothetical protein n=1 Tax=Bradyrhizobium cosmicum TaxID=1404864 RepID=UPI0028EFE6F6|nr:hypothetical protein [Bradyrhizobium cosmicum]
MKKPLIDALGSGEIGVPAVVWKEFKELYEDEAEELEPSVVFKIPMKKQYRSGAARIADKLNSGFSRGPYDSETDLYTAAIASLEDYPLITSSGQAPYYDGMGCKVLDLAGWADEFG